MTVAIARGLSSDGVTAFSEWYLFRLVHMSLFALYWKQSVNMLTIVITCEAYVTYLQICVTMHFRTLSMHTHAS